MEPAAGITVSEFSQQAGQEQQPVQIYCIYSANPFQLVPGSVRWFKDGLPLVAASLLADRRVESFTPTGYPMLVLKQANRADAGRYDCQLANSVGTSERLPSSEACKLEVNFRPSVQLKLLKTLGVDSTPLGNEQEPTAGNGNLIEVDLEQELALPGDEFVLACNVLEAQPGKINSFHWFSRPYVGTANGQQTSEDPNQKSATGISRNPAGQLNLRPLAITEGPKFKLAPMRANFTPASYSCAAVNAIGQSDPSEPIDLQLSYTPGKSRPVRAP